MKFITKLMLIFGVVGLAACTSPSVPSVDDIVPEPSPFGTVIIGHFSPDAPNVNVYVDGTLQAGDVPYGFLAGGLFLEGTVNIQIEAILPDGATAIVLDEDVTIPVRGGFIGGGYTFLGVIGDVGNLSLLQVDQTTLTADVPANNFPALVTHASPAVEAAVGGPVDVYVTAPGVPLAGEMPVGSFSFGETLDLGNVPAGTYQVRVGFDPGTGFVVAYDSGPVDIAPLDYVHLWAHDTVGAISGANGFSPALLTGFAGGLVSILDVNLPSGVRAVHASNDAGAVDIVLDGPTTVTAAGVDFLGVFPGTSGVAAIPKGDYDITVTPVGAMDPAIGPVTLDANNGLEHLVVALGTVTNSTLTAIIDSPVPPPRSIPLFGQARLVHAAEGAGTVDVFVLAAGADAPDVDTTVAPVISGFAFQDVEAHTAIDEGAYDIYITPTGTRTAAITALNFPVVNGDVITVIAVDGPANDPTAFDLLVLEDAALAP